MQGYSQTELLGKENKNSPWKTVILVLQSGIFLQKAELTCPVEEWSLLWLILCPHLQTPGGGHRGGSEQGGLTHVWWLAELGTIPSWLVTLARGCLEISPFACNCLCQGINEASPVTILYTLLSNNSAAASPCQGLDPHCKGFFIKLFIPNTATLERSYKICQDTGLIPAKLLLIKPSGWQRKRLIRSSVALGAA